MSWIQTYTGRVFEPLDPKPDQVDIADIAHALSMTCRFNGHCVRFYSVAEHSVWVSRLVPPPYARWGLLHDAAEAYVSDVARPIKPHIKGFDQIEAAILAVILERFGLEPRLPEAVVEADLRMLATERMQLMHAGVRDWAELDRVDGYPVDLACWSPQAAEEAFMQRYREVFG